MAAKKNLFPFFIITATDKVKSYMRRKKFLANDFLQNKLLKFPSRIRCLSLNGFVDKLNLDSLISIVCVDGSEIHNNGREMLSSVTPNEALKIKYL